uniref:Genome polyprotein n=1 Tax=Avocet picornavirus B TaxID=2212790 RepID=A0A3G1RP90_9VIRU|nr:MAG: polyprotein [Avocet picornavirus B]
MSNVVRHERLGAACLTCSRLILFTRDPEDNDFTPVYPLRHSCLRGEHVNHDFGCNACEARRWVRGQLDNLYVPPRMECDKCGQEHTMYKNKHICRYNCQRHEDLGICCLCDLFSKICITDEELLTGKTDDGWELDSLLDENCNHGYEADIEASDVEAEEQGQGSSHQTGNHSTNTTAGGAVTTINYYGANYNYANNPMAQSIDPTAVASGVAGIAGVPTNFIASPTMEALAGDTSDRIMALIAGNSSIVTQEAAKGAVVAYGKEPTYLEAQHNTVDLPTRPGPASDRFYTLTSQPWNTASKGWSIPFPGALSNLGVFGTNLQFHYLWRSGVCFHVQVSATPFHAGTLLVALVPEGVIPVEQPDIGNAYAATSFFQIAQRPLMDDELAQLTVFPHQLINVRTNLTATIVAAYNNFTSATCFTVHNICRLVIVPLVPLAVPSGAQTEVDITVSVLPLCSQFNGLRSAIDVQGLPVFQIPGSSQFVTTLANDGYPAYPVWNEVPRFPLAGRVDNFLSVARIPTFCTLGDGGKLYLEVSTNQAAARLLNLDLSLLSKQFDSTYVARLARMFGYYRGTLTLSLMYCGPKMSSGKFLVAYTPPGGNAPETRDEAMLSTHVIWDVGLQSTLTFPIPYVSAGPYRYANKTGSILSYDGFVTMFYQTSVVFAPNAGTSAKFLATLAAGSDFSLHGLMDTPAYQGPGDGPGDVLQQAINDTVTNAIAGAATTLPNGPNQAMTLELNPGMQNGAASMLQAAETGAMTVTNPTAAVTIEPGSIHNLSANETSMANLCSRYFRLHTEVYGSSNTRKNFVVDINFEQIFSESKIAQSILEMVTYFRSDLDIVALISSPTPVTMQMVYCPPGSYTSGASFTGAIYKGVNPSVYVTSGQSPGSLRIPYSLPVPYIPVFYDGFPDFASGAKKYSESKYGVSTVRSFGKLICAYMSGNPTGVVVQLFVRFVNPEGYMPRPIKYHGTTPPNSKSRGRIEIGDRSNFEPIPDTCVNWEEYQRMMDEVEEQGPEIDLPSYPDTDVDIDGVWINREFYWRPAAFVHSDYWRFVAINSPDDSYLDAHLASVAMDDFLQDRGEEAAMWYISVSRNYGEIRPYDRSFQRRHELVLSSAYWVLAGIEDAGYASAEEQGPLQSFGEGIGKGLKDAFKSALEEVEKMRGSQTSWWSTIVKYIMKFVSMMVILIRSKGDPGTVAAVAGLIGAEMMEICPFEWIKGKICKTLGIAQEQGPTPFRQFLDFTNSVKAVEWIIGKLKELIDWIREKIKPKCDTLEEEADDLERLHAAIKEWREYMKHPEDYKQESAVGLANRILMLRDMVEKDSPEAMLLRLNSQLFTSVAKFVANAKTRSAEPIGVIIHGEPGTGKSVATKMIGAAMSKYYGGVEPYSLPPDPKYFDGYVGQPVVIMDDLGQNPDGEDMKLVCQMISSVDFTTPQADLTDKGRPFTSRLVLASTNCKDLTPPTVMCPPALRRRFKFDLDIINHPAFAFDDGKLDMEKALKPCDHASLCFSGCCPLICGKAISFKERKTGEIFSMDKLVIRIRSMDKQRHKISSSVDAYLQGNGKRVVSFLEPATAARRPMTPEILELVNGDPSGAMVRYAYNMGYEIPADLTDMVTKQEVRQISNKWRNAALTVGAILMVLTLGYTIYKAMPRQSEGPYDGYTEKRLPRPVQRVEVQGGVDPDTQFATSLLRHNIFPVKTGSGYYTALGVFGTKVLLPTHAVDDYLEVDGKQHDFTVVADYFKDGVKTEMTLIDVPTLQDFKDIRKFLKPSFVPVKDALLVLNTPDMPRMVVPLRRVTRFGNLNLSGNNTANTIFYQSPTKKGYCGAVVMKAGYIIGMHIGGDGVNGFAALLTSSYFATEQGQIVSMQPTPTPVRVNRKTAFEPSVYHHLIDVKKQPAPLTRNDPRLEVDLDTAMFSKYKGNHECNWPELGIAVEQYARQLKPLLPPDVLEPLSLEQVVHGYGSLRPLDLATSAGFPYCRQGLTKRKLVDDDCRLLIEGLDLHGYDQPFVTSIKDELRGIAKVKAGKSRLIEASSINDTVRMRTKYGRLFEALCAQPGTASGMAVGCNPDVDWTRFAVEMGDNIFSFDYTNFDASLSPFWFKALKDLLARLGFEPGREIDHIVNSKHIYGNVEYVVEGGMPSGCSGTSIFNSLINNLILKTLTLRIYKGIDLDALKIIAYGDDCLISYPFALDPELYAKFGEQLGLKITPADKSDVFKTPGPITEHTFLKRGFAYDEKVPFLVHPTFDEGEIYQSLAWTKDPRTMPEHVMSLARLIWHNGKDTYDRFEKFIYSVPVGRAFHVPAYEALYREWVDMF